MEIEIKKKIQFNKRTKKIKRTRIKINIKIKIIFWLKGKLKRKITLTAKTKIIKWYWPAYSRWELWEGGTGHKLTKERNKNKDDQHQNTNIPFKRGINTRGGKRDDFSSPSKPVVALAAETLPLQRKKN